MKSRAARGQIAPEQCIWPRRRQVNEQPAARAPIVKAESRARKEALARRNQGGKSKIFPLLIEETGGETNSATHISKDFADGGRGIEKSCGRGKRTWAEGEGELAPARARELGPGEGRKVSAG